MRILILNGPNLNMTGRRQTDVYGTVSLDAYLPRLIAQFPAHHIDCRQSNCEGELIGWIQQAVDRYDAIILNAGAYTHYSYAIADAIAAVAPLPVIEVHISQPAAREPFRHLSVIAPVCRGTISGFGLESYRIALQAILS